LPERRKLPARNISFRTLAFPDFSIDNDIMSDAKNSTVQEAPTPDCPIMVMLVDDQAIVGEAVRRLLAREPDMDLHYCSDALAAIEQAIQIKPTVVLLDLVMPGLDGFELLARFRAHPLTVHIPIVVLSTTEDPEVKSRAFTTGADDYLVKLPNRVELIARLRYHSRSYQNLLQRDEAYRALRESQQKLLDSNTALTALNLAYHQAKEEAENANRAKSEFLSRMSHELRTPLNAILGFSQLLEMEEITPRQRESVRHIMKAGTHLLELINEMLDIARVEAGRISLSLEPVSVFKVLDESLQLIRPMSCDFGIEVTAPSEEKCPYFVIADHQRLKQVLINLLTNAVKYNRPNGSVNISCIAAPPEQLAIHITDTGQGIAEADIGKLFTPFERLHADSSGIEGTGLGLTLSQRLVEAMGGTLEASSTPGQGSTFTINLPVAPDVVEKIAEVAALEPEIVSSEASPRNVLLIEDNISNRNLVEAIFSSQPGVTLLAAMQGSVGLDLARQHQPDLILLDLHLPDMTGWNALQHLQADPATVNIPVVVLSADATPSQIERLMAAGARAYLTKPLNVKEFLSVLNSIFQELS
jgi:signal transduction histidine kinase